MDLQEKKQDPKQVYKNSSDSYEEISEKKTSKLGYILLIIMTFFIFGVGQTVFSDLKRIPARPEAPSSCVVSTLKYLETLNSIRCPRYQGFNETDKQFELDQEFEKLRPQLNKIVSFNSSIGFAQKEIRNLEKQIKDLNDEYDLSLQEKMAGEDPITNKQMLRMEISRTKNQLSSQESSLKSLESQRALVVSEVQFQKASLEKNYEEARDFYQTKRAWYKFKVFILTLIFVLPFFVFSVFYYLRLKRKNSPYTIILAALATAFSILFLQVMGTFLYEILPKTWFARIFEFFLNVPFLRYIIYYGSILLIIGVFGGIVYYIQKKVFDPVKVAVRRLKDKKCPGCSFTLDSNHNFCPDCGLQLKEKCEHCEKQKVRYLSHCPNCGKE